MPPGAATPSSAGGGVHLVEEAVRPPIPASDSSNRTEPASAAGVGRQRSDTAEIDTTLSHPGSVRINFKGAFIAEDEIPAAAAALPEGKRDSRDGSPSHHGTKGIRLPNHTDVVSHIAVDIGGSLAKLVYFSREAHSTEPGGRLNFQSFETDRIDECLAFMRHLKDEQQPLNGSPPSALCVVATGGGAYKYYDKIRDALGVDVLREDEIECLIIGLDFFIAEIPREVFTYSDTEPMHFVPPTANTAYPYLLVNIGSGVSMIKVTGPREYLRVGGTSLGGGTLWGLLSLLTGARTFDEMLDMASRGDNSRVDMLVGDIYGSDYSKVGLKSSTIASSFGKVFRMKREAENEAEDGGGLGSAGMDRYHARAGPRSEAGPLSPPSPPPQSPPAPATTSQDPSALQHHQAANSPDNIASNSAATTATQDPSERSRFSSADVSQSLLYAISNNIGQIAFLQSQIHGVSNIYFSGSFIRGHPPTMNTLSYGVKFWSEGAKRAYFLRHEGYLGAVGAFLKRQPRNWGRRGSLS